MRLTRYTDYCLRVLIYLGLKEGRLATIQEVSEHYGISRNHLMKVVFELNRNGYIETQRGKNGGMRLGRRPGEIHLGEVVRRCEPDLDLVECFSDGDTCRIAAACRLKAVLGSALGAFLKELDHYSLADLLQPESQLVELLDMRRAPDRPPRE